jgi:hypothetical protein
MDLDDITRQSEFDFATSAFGTVRVSVMTSFDIDAAENALERLSPEDVARLIFTRLARPTTVTYEDHPSLESPEKYFDGDELTQGEVEEFANTIYKNYRYLSNNGKKERLERSESESSTAFLARVLMHHRDEQKASRAKLFGPVSSSIFSDASRRTWAGSAMASERLGATVQQMREERLFPTVPKLASQTTNELLEDLGRKLDTATPVVQDMAAAILALEQTVRTMQADAVRNGAKADRKTLTANRIAGVGIFLSLAALMISIVQMRNDSVVRNLQQIQTELRSERAGLTHAFNQLANELKRPPENSAERPKAADSDDKTSSTPAKGASEDRRDSNSTER